jgi:hypothetical protein
VTEVVDPKPPRSAAEMFLHLILIERCSGFDAEDPRRRFVPSTLQLNVLVRPGSVPPGT